MDEAPLASLSLTHVHYVRLSPVPVCYHTIQGRTTDLFYKNPNDPLSYLSAWLALVPQALCVVYVTLMWASREVEILMMFAGQMACEAFNFLLKRWIKEERPKRTTARKHSSTQACKFGTYTHAEMFGKGYGMPSSHSQFVTFFSVSLSLFLLLRHVPTPSTTHSPTSLPERLLLSSVACLCAVAVVVSRVYLNYHTPKQVLAGCAAGAFSATAWFLVTTYLRRYGWVEWALDSQVAEMFRVRDLVITEDLVDAGWGRWKEKRKDQPRVNTSTGLEKKAR
jgi:dolichyldiphosphatase